MLPVRHDLRVFSDTGVLYDRGFCFRWGVYISGKFRHTETRCVGRRVRLALVRLRQSSPCKASIDEHGWYIALSQTLQRSFVSIRLPLMPRALSQCGHKRGWPKALIIQSWPRCPTAAASFIIHFNYSFSTQCVRKTAGSQLHSFHSRYHSFSFTFADLGTTKMGFGILEDRHMAAPPGTSTINDSEPARRIHPSE